jgi:hypothetical protein
VEEQAGEGGGGLEREGREGGEGGDGLGALARLVVDLQGDGEEAPQEFRQCLVVAHADELEQQRHREQARSAVFFDDLEQGDLGKILAALGVDDPDVGAGQDPLLELFEGDVLAVGGVVEPPVGVFLDEQRRHGQGPLYTRSAPGDPLMLRCKKIVDMPLVFSMLSRNKTSLPRLLAVECSRCGSC